MIRILVTLCACIVFSHSAYSQSIKENAFDLGFSFGVESPLADLQDRFGAVYGGDFSANYYFGKPGINFALKLGFLTSDAVREDVFAAYRTSEGQLLSVTGVPTVVNSRMAGSYLGVNFSKNVLNIGEKENARLFIGLGAGIMQHKIRFVEFTRTVPLAFQDYGKGHDRNSRGPYIEQEVGIKVRKDSKKKYDLSIFAFEGFLKPVSAIEFDTGNKNQETRFDAAIGIKLKWYISITASEKGKDLYY